MGVPVLPVDHSMANGHDHGVAVHNAAVCAEPLHLGRAYRVASVPVAAELHHLGADLRCAECWTICRRTPRIKNYELF